MVYANPNFDGTNDFFLPDDVILIDHELALAMKPPAWAKDGACRAPNAANLDKFFPESTKHGGNHLKPARELCLKCPVRYECLEYGIDEPWGVWGGHSPSQRRRIISLVKNGSSLLEASQVIDARSRDARG